MARVCIDWYPKGWDKRQRKAGFYLDDTLKQQLDVLINNITDDWDFTILITGSGQVRVGKSVLAMQIGAYWAYEVQRLFGKKTIFNVNPNFVFDGKKLIEKGNYLGINYPYNVLVFDEAGADLEGRKAIQSITQDVLDFYRECGQYNLMNILVIPEYFDLPRGIAMSRSIFLIDVRYTATKEGKFKRGYFFFYNRKRKKRLYLRGKKELNYNAEPYSFRGRFYPFYPIDEAEYRLEKQHALSTRENKRRNKFQKQRDAAWFILTTEFKVNQIELGKRMEQLTGIYTPQQTISDALIRLKGEND